jgi:hypothetical protein
VPLKKANPHQAHLVFPSVITNAVKPKELDYDCLEKNKKNIKKI